MLPHQFPHFHWHALCTHSALLMRARRLIDSESPYMFLCGQSWRVFHSCAPLVASSAIPTPFLYNTHTLYVPNVFQCPHSCLSPVFRLMLLWWLKTKTRMTKRWLENSHGSGLPDKCKPPVHFLSETHWQKHQFTPMFICKDYLPTCWPPTLSESLFIRPNNDHVQIQIIGQNVGETAPLYITEYLQSWSHSHSLCWLSWAGKYFPEWLSEAWGCKLRPCVEKGRKGKCG